MTSTTDAAHDTHLGHDALDLEHEGQTDLLTALETELLGAQDKARLGELLGRLIEFTEIHFMSEQVLMRERAYPGLPAHEAEHDRLMEQMRGFQNRIGSGECSLTPGDVSALRDWVLNHIRTKDTAFARYLAAGTQL